MILDLFLSLYNLYHHMFVKTIFADLLECAENAVILRVWPVAVAKELDRSNQEASLDSVTHQT